MWNSNHGHPLFTPKPFVQKKKGITIGSYTNRRET